MQNKINKKYLYSHTILGGIFDHFHQGHKLLIDTAFNLSAFVTIGIGTEHLYSHKYLADSIESYDTRYNTLVRYLTQRSWLSRTSLISISDIYGTCLSDRSINAIVARNENMPNVALINLKRKEHDLPELRIIKITDVNGLDGRIISSERIRAGEIDRNGFVYETLFDHDLYLPKKFRSNFRRPLGEIISEPNLRWMTNTKRIIITVGDVVTADMMQNNFRPDISIIDLKTRRQELAKNHYASLSTLLTKAHIVWNDPGTIRSGAVKSLRTSLLSFYSEHEKQTIAIEGEEDLLTLPAILLAPLGSMVYYGQYNKGIICVDVTESKKKEVELLIQRLTPNGSMNVL